MVRALGHRPVPPARGGPLPGRRVLLRPLQLSDWPQWHEVRTRCADWLERWEPARGPGDPDFVRDRDAFALRCSARHRELQLGTAYGFGIFTDGQLCGEINVGAVRRGAFHSAYVGYWMDQRWAGQGLMPEAVVVVMSYAFDDLKLHRLQISIIPRNHASRRVVEKLGLRSEGVAQRYLQINGVWEDHIRFAITAEEWAERAEGLRSAWL